MRHKRVIFGGLNRAGKHPALRFELQSCPSSFVYFICPADEYAVRSTGSHSHIAFVTDGWGRTVAEKTRGRVLKNRVLDQVLKQRQRRDEGKRLDKLRREEAMRAAARAGWGMRYYSHVYTQRPLAHISTLIFPCIPRQYLL